MSRTYLTLGDIAGKLTILASNARGANGRAATTLPKLLAQHGHRGNMSKVGLRPEMRLSLSNSLEPKRLELLRKLIPKPTRNTFEVGCARAATGHVAAPPSRVMNSRRSLQLGSVLIAAPNALCSIVPCRLYRVPGGHHLQARRRIWLRPRRPRPAVDCVLAIAATCD